MIELTDEQRQELSTSEPTAIDPQTRAEYVLVPREVYERLRDFLSDDTIYSTAEVLDRVMAEDDANDPGLGWNDMTVLAKGLLRDPTGE